MSVLAVVEMEAVPGRAAELLALVAETLVDVRAAEGFESVTVHQDQDVPERLIAIERWTAREHHEATRQGRTDTGMTERMRPLLATRPVIRYFDDVDIQPPWPTAR